MTTVCSGSFVPQSLCWLPRNLCPELSVGFEWPPSWVINRGPQASVWGEENSHFSWPGVWGRLFVHVDDTSDVQKQVKTTHLDNVKRAAVT